jgi:ATP-dependent DNA helicase RecQ
LLSYFGELVTENCGNCDICKNPPEFFDGTIIAQKALSAIMRLKESEPLPVIIDFLRGSKNAYIFENGYQNLKTYAIGIDISWYDWNQYIIQLINQGLCEIAFHRQNKIRLTALAREVLFEGDKVQLTTVIKVNTEKTELKESKSKVAANSLFETLRKLRYEISKEESVPAYVIFSDAALRQMEKIRPMSDDEFITIDGVGKVKLEKYGDAFIKAIIAFQKNKIVKPKKEAGTYKETLLLFQSGLTAEEIALKRKLGITTVMSHLAKLYLDGEPVDLYQFVSDAEVQLIAESKLKLESPTTLKPYYDYLEEKMAYDKIRLALAIIEKEKRN